MEQVGRRALRPQQTGFKTKTAAWQWLSEKVAPTLDRGTPSPDITFDRFAARFLERHGAAVSERTRETLDERLKAARAAFGARTLRELEGASDDIARWRAGLTDTSRYRLTLAFKQTLNAAVRWRYLSPRPGRRGRA